MEDRVLALTMIDSTFVDKIVLMQQRLDRKGPGKFQLVNAKRGFLNSENGYNV